MTVSEYARQHKISNQTVRNRAKAGILRIEELANGRTNVVEINGNTTPIDTSVHSSGDLQQKKLLVQIAKMESEIAWKDQKLREYEEKLVARIHAEYSAIFNDVAVVYRKFFEGLKLGRDAIKKLNKIHERFDKRVARLIEGVQDDSESQI